jgi:hypothetical protein
LKVTYTEEAVADIVDAIGCLKRTQSTAADSSMPTSRDASNVCRSGV